MIDRIQESKLVKGISQGNILAFNSIFREYSCRLYRFINGYIKSDTESEQIVQDVFMKIWEKRADLREELSFKSYLFTIAFNLIRKHFRAKAMISEYLHSGTQEESDMHTSVEISYNSLLSYVSEIVDQLPEKRKLIFMKSRFEGQSIKEIAEELKISHKTVENQLTDALKFIRTNLKKEELAAILFAVLCFL
jgi:RNA polymerase sigma-70 factor (ECF subfamily)